MFAGPHTMTSTLKNLTIRQAAAACLFMAIAAGLLLVILKQEELLPSDFAVHAALFMLFMLFIGIGTLGTFLILLWLAPDRPHALRWFARTILFIGVGAIGTFGILLSLAPERVLGIPWFIILLWLLWVTDGQLFPGIDDF